VVGLSESLDEQQRLRENSLAKKKAEREMKKFNTYNEQTSEQWQNRNCENCQPFHQTGTFETEADRPYYP
jgi:hypothetical protein